ncbi:MAG: FkbM family methyltransferase [Streptosporangiales bacterium]|nr:FkbM family methyltransferase [Streptosporangiales bacterium]
MAAWTPWVEGEVRGLQQVVRSGDVVVDVGAGLGIYTCVLSRLVGPTGVVVSVEPLPGLYAAYDAWLRLRRGGNVSRYDGALGSAAQPAAPVSVPLRRQRPVTGRAFVTTGATGFGSNGEFAGHREYDVPVTTLDQLVNRLDLDRVDFVKADVEGAELAVLRGATTTIGASRPTVLLEIEDRHLRRYGYSSGDVVSWFHAHGYEMSVWAEGAWRPVSRVTQLRRNYLFRPAVDADA